MAENVRSSVERDYGSKNAEDAKGSAGTITRRSSGSGRGQVESDTTPGSSGTTAHRLRPHYTDKFNIGRVEKVLQAAIQQYMQNKTYLTQEAENWTSELSGILNSLVKQFNFPRYKLVSIVTIGENVGGGVHMGMKTLWDSETDSFASYTYMTDTLFVVGAVCGVYFY